MKTYIRFGEIPESEKSINFRKISFDVSDRFHDLIKAGEIKVAYELIPDTAMENGVSVFDMENDTPVIDNYELVKSLTSRLGGGITWTGEEIKMQSAYIVTGNEVGKGKDGEPLITNVRTIGIYGKNADELLQMAVNEMKKHFASCKKVSEDKGSKCVYSFYKDIKVNEKTGQEVEWFETTEENEWKRLQYTEYYLGGWKFKDCVDNFVK